MMRTTLGFLVLVVVATGLVGLGARAVLAQAAGDEVVIREPALDPIAVKLPVHKSRMVRLPVDVREEEEFATYWNDVIMPEGFPSVAGPEPEYDFIRSAKVTEFAQRIRGMVESQRATWLRASVTEPTSAALAWDLDIAWDRGVRLVVHEGTGDREAHSRLTLVQMHELEHALRQVHRPLRATYGAGAPELGVRTLSVLDPEAPLTTVLRQLDDETLDPAGWRELPEHQRIGADGFERIAQRRARGMQGDGAHAEAARKVHHQLETAQRIANIGSWQWEFATGALTCGIRCRRETRSSSTRPTRIPRA